MKNKYLFYSFISIILIFSIISFFDKDKIFSEFENRSLKHDVNYKFKDFLTGNFQRDYEKYTHDQFPLRDEWISLKSRFEYLLGKIENNGIVYGNDNWLFEKFVEINEERLKKILKQ